MKINLLTRLVAMFLLCAMLLTSSCCITGLFDDDDDDNLPGSHDEGTGGAL
jgi:hypothetical protein